MEDRAAAYAEGLARLIREKTISVPGKNPEGFPAFRALLTECFPQVFNVCKEEIFQGNLLLCWEGKHQDAPILFMNHHDVVEAPGEWLHPPFAGEIAEGKLWGRGTLDTKGGLFCMLQAAEELMTAGFVPEQDIWFESSCDEEQLGTGADKVSQVLKERGIRFAFVLDEGGMTMYDPLGGADGTFAMIGVGEKGCADLRFVAKSSGGHASTPGKNTPLVRLGRFMTAADRKKLFPAQLSPVTREMLRRMAPAMKKPLQVVLGHPDFFAPLLRVVMPMISPTAGAMLKTTLAFTMARGSDAPNVLPQEAWVAGNMRFSHHQGGEASIAAVRRLAKKYGVETVVDDPGFSSPLTDWRHEGFRRVEDAVARCFPGVIPCPYVMTGASDCRWMSRVSDCCLRYTPFQIDDTQMTGIHGLNENVDIACLPRAVDFYRVLMGGTPYEEQ